MSPGRRQSSWCDHMHVRGVGVCSWTVATDAQVRRLRWLADRYTNTVIGTLVLDGWAVEFLSRVSILT